MAVPFSAKNQNWHWTATGHHGRSPPKIKTGVGRQQDITVVDRKKSKFAADGITKNTMFLVVVGTKIGVLVPTATRHHGR